MRVLVTGASGFVGGRLLARLALREDSEAVGLSRRRPEGLAERVEHLAVDLTDRDATLAAVRAVEPDRLVHLAAVALPASCREEPARALATAVTGTASLLAALRPAARAVVASSSQVYGRSSASPIPETAPLRPTSPYGRSKRAEEAVALAAAQRGTAVVVARPFNHSGAGQSADYVLPSLARQVARAAAEGTAVRTGNLFPRRDFLHVEDVLDAYELLLEAGRSGEAYNVSSGRGTSIEELLDAFRARAGGEIRVETDPARVRADDPPEIFGDASKLQALGWRPRRGMDVLLDELWNEAVVPPSRGPG